ncbi:histone chaperone [Thelephora terrestris]|uniref:Anti-silencing function protein 1 n=1 Tax=Thelephora terrestris TaxID=56493 RepID=A0A9P6L6H3_9AGAM|nr:histone chaperone [Thelephora terrestris]
MSIVTIRSCSPVAATERRGSNNPARFLDPYYLRVTFECFAPLEDDLEWRLIYVSSPGNEDLEQELDDCLVGPVPVGINAFGLEGSRAGPRGVDPDWELKEQELVWVGYYQDTEWEVEDGGMPTRTGDVDPDN